MTFSLDELFVTGLGYGSGSDDDRSGADSDSDLEDRIKKKKEEYARKQDRIFSDVDDDG